MQRTAYNECTEGETIMEVKDIIRTYREKLNLTMKQLADRVGVSEGTISR